MAALGDSLPLICNQSQVTPIWWFQQLTKTQKQDYVQKQKTMKTTFFGTTLKLCMSKQMT